jgi:uncharacterized protein (TIGR01777 family)
MSRKVLITGGTGLIGKNLTKMLQDRGYEVAWVSRERKKVGNVQVFQWDVERGYLEEGTLEHADYLIHLSGAGVAEQRWTPERQKVILESRTKSIELITQKMKEKDIRPRAFISASGSGYYGADTGNQRNTENTEAGHDFLSTVSVAWEKATDEIASMGVRTVQLRTGVVLSQEGGAIQKMAQPAQFGMGAALGSGEQWVSWIHIDDICRVYIAAMENESWAGPYNAVTASPVTNKQLTKTICAVLHRPLWLPNVPEFALRIAFGAMASIVLGSSYVVNERLARETDFNYQFPELQGALEAIFARG